MYLAYMSVSLYLYIIDLLSSYLPIHPSIHISDIYYLIIYQSSIYLSINPSTHLWDIYHLSMYPPTHPSMHLLSYLAFHLQSSFAYILRLSDSGTRRSIIFFLNLIHPSKGHFTSSNLINLYLIAWFYWWINQISRWSST